MNEQNKKLEKLLTELNKNIETLTKVTALSFRKDTLFREKATKQEQLQALEELSIPDHIIALIIGSTVESIRALRSQRKSKTKKNEKSEPENQQTT